MTYILFSHEHELLKSFVQLNTLFPFSSLMKIASAFKPEKISSGFALYLCNLLLGQAFLDI